MGEARESTEASGARVRAERVIRRAARASNRLLAGARVHLRVSDPALRAAYTGVLARMGARVLEGTAGGSESDLILTDTGALGPVRGASAPERIDWAAARMPATRALAEELAETGALRGVRVAVSLVLEPKTAVLVLALRDAGAEVAVFGAANETDPEVAQALAARGLKVFAPDRRVGAATAAAVDAAHAAGVLNWAPELLIDDGSHLIRLAHRPPARALRTLRGASEETTSGVRPLRDMHAAGHLRIPVIAANDARTKTGFDNLIGTGQSCVFAIADALDAPQLARFGFARGTAGQRWAVVGYGPVGVGVARFAAALGARVTVVEQDAVRALAALHDGFEAKRAAEALPEADVVVSATGMWHTLDADALASLRPGAAVAVAGGVDDELALDELLVRGWEATPLTGDIDRWAPASAAGSEPGVLVLARGAGVNYTAAEGNPIEVMDLSFATQLASLEILQRGGLSAGVHALPSEVEDRVARAALVSRGGSADPPPHTQRAATAGRSWRAHRYQPAPDQPEG